MHVKVVIESSDDFQNQKNIVLIFSENKNSNPYNITAAMISMYFKNTCPIVSIMLRAHTFVLMPTSLYLYHVSKFVSALGFIYISVCVCFVCVSLLGWRLCN